MSQDERGVDRSVAVTISERVPLAVADELDVDPIDLPPLYDVIDPDALDALFRELPGQHAGTGRVEFTVAGCEVTVHGDGDVDVAAPRDHSSAAATASDEQDETETALD